MTTRHQLDWTNHIAKHRKWPLCKACKEIHSPSYSTEGYCQICWRKAEALWERLDKLTLRNQIEGRGRTSEAQYVRGYCKDERAKAKEELKSLGLPTRRPGDAPEIHGPGQAHWQRAGQEEGDTQ